MFSYLHPLPLLQVHPLDIHTLDLSHTQLPAGPQKQQLPIKPLYMIVHVLDCSPQPHLLSG